MKSKAKKAIDTVLFGIYGIILLFMVTKSVKSKENTIRVEQEETISDQFKKESDWSEDESISNSKKAYFDYLYSK